MERRGGEKGEDRKRKRRKANPGEAEGKCEASTRFACLPKVDIVEKGKECVLLLTNPARYTMAASTPEWPVLAWYPDEKLVGAVSNRLMPRSFVPLACSPSGLLCGIRYYGYEADYVFRLAAHNPSTGFQRRLPVLRLDEGGEKMTADETNSRGLTRIQVGGDDKQFRVDVLRTQMRHGHAIYSFDSSSDAWTLVSWVARDMPPTGGGLAGEFLFWDGGLKAYDAGSGCWSGAEFPRESGGQRPGVHKFPVPEEVAGYEYYRAFPLWHGRRALLAALCYAPCDEAVPGLALLERDELHQEELVFKAVTGVTLKEEPERTLPYTLPWVVSGHGKLTVFSDDCFVWPVALDLERHVWMEFPTEYRYGCSLPKCPTPVCPTADGSIVPACVYTPHCKAR